MPILLKPMMLTLCPIINIKVVNGVTQNTVVFNNYKLVNLIERVCVIDNMRTIKENNESVEHNI